MIGVAHRGRRHVCAKVVRLLGPTLIALGTSCATVTPRVSALSFTVMEDSVASFACGLAFEKLRGPTLDILVDAFPTANAPMLLQARGGRGRNSTDGVTVEFAALRSTRVYGVRCRMHVTMQMKAGITGGQVAIVSDEAPVVRIYSLRERRLSTIAIAHVPFDSVIAFPSRRSR
jgi:hypothetical protein